MPENHQPSNNGALTSWKEIAAHFHREVRTVQRWEKEEGLPVHRHLHQRQSSVYAYREELEAWWHERGAQLAAASPPTSWEKRNSWFLLSAVPIVLVLVGLFLWKNPHPAPDPPAVVAAPQFHTVVFSGTRPGGMLHQGLIGDLNGDGRGDLVLSAYTAREAYVLFGRNHPLEGGELPENADVVITHAGGLGLLAGSVGDFNGDGFDDLVLTHWLDEPDAFRRTGPSYILWGRSSWPKRIRLPEQADATLRLDYPSDAKMGACNTSGSVSDVNGDGIADLLLDAYEHGLPDRLSSGTLFVLYGRKRWPREVEVASFADVTVHGSRTAEGLETARLGDFNGDGRLDLTLYSNENRLWNQLGGRGKHFIVLGRPTWPKTFDVHAERAFQVDGTRPDVRLFTYLLADVNGDGRDDLVIGRAGFRKLPNDPGELHIWFGGKDRRGAFPADAADVAIIGSSPGAELGHALAAYDVDGDGFKDLFVSEHGRGRVFLLYGRRDWKKNGTLRDHGAIQIFEGEVGAGFGQMSLGDLDGDKIPELVFSSPEVNASPQVPNAAGRAWVLKPYLPVRLDVRPDWEPNIVLVPDWVCVVRVFGTSHTLHDAIDPASLRLGGAAVIEYSVQDYNGDGIPDIQATFDTGRMKLTAETKRIAITGRTRSGLPVAGADNIVVVPLSEGRASFTPSPIPKAR